MFRSEPLRSIFAFLGTPLPAAIVLLILAAGAVPALARPLPAASAAPKLAPLAPYRTSVPPVLDGVLDDPVWAQAPAETGFKTWMPDYGRDMSEKTVVQYAYDEENIYFAYRCFDRRPDLVKASVTSRDNISRDDWICLNIDTFDDQQSLYALYVNPLGIQGDSRFEAGAEDFSVDVVWYSAGKIDDRGYAIEVKLPFKSIRYSRREPVRMGIIFERRISRLSQGGTFPPLDPAQGPNFLTQTRQLLFENIRHYTLLELIPAATYGRTSALDAGTLRAAPGEANLSLTGKYGLTSQLILDGAVNPDFSQVESDAGQVDFNQRYALYYPEKRPFFLEGQEKFTLGACQPGDPLGSAVNTRTIVDPNLGFKLNGKVTSRDTLAAIYAADALPAGGPADSAHVTIARYKHALSQDGYAGGFWTGRFDGARSNVVAGVDGQIRVSKPGLFGYHALFSNVKAEDAAGVSSSSNGHAAALDYLSSDRDWTYDIAVQDLSKGFETDTGYLTRNGITRLKVGVLRMVYPKSDLFLRLDPMAHVYAARDKFSGLWESIEQFDLRVQLPRTTQITLGGRAATEVWMGRRFDRSWGRFLAMSQVTRRVFLSLQATAGAKIRYVDDPYQGRGADLLAGITYLPTENLSFALNLTYSDFTRSADGSREYDYTIVRSVNTYQVNKYLFVRAIGEYNTFRARLVTDFLASFTYIPGTVIHVGYGSAYEKTAWEVDRYIPSDRFLEARRGFFFKASYLWRM